MAMDFNGIAFWELLDEKQTVTSEVYKNFLDSHIPNWSRGNGCRNPIIVQDNARPHVASIVKEYLNLNNIETWIQPPYSPDLQPCDYNCFGPLKQRLSGKQYHNWAELKEAIQKNLEDGLVEGLFLGVRKLPDRWERVIENKGNYL